MINTEFLALPEFRKSSRASEAGCELQHAAVYDGERWPARKRCRIGAICLTTVKNEGTREVNVQRYKGLGEMNAEQFGPPR